MLDLVDLEYYCYSGVWNAGLFWRDWVQCNDRRQHQKRQKTEEKCEGSLEKVKPPRKTWTLTRIGSNIMQKTLKKNNEEIQELRKCSSSEEEDETILEDISQLSIPILPESGLHIPVNHIAFPCGTFTEILSAEFSHSPITIKREKPRSYCGISILRKEVHVLNQIHHPNILLLMGAVRTDNSGIVTIFEDASNGTLHHLLHQKKTVLPPKEIQKFLTQLCHVMLFLHDRGWLHTSITSHTIVITANSTLKLTGFEMAQRLNSTENGNSITKHLRNQWFQWQSPEQLNGQTPLNKETDIFSVGVIGWEMCINAEPWFGYTRDELLIKYKSLNCALQPEGLPSFVHSKHESFLSCMQHMMQVDPKKRICFLDVLSQVHKLQALPLSTPHLVSDHIQPIHFIGSLERTQLIFQPKPQKAMLTSNKHHKQDRDPYTGLKRVSNSWQKLNGKTHSTTSLNIMNLRSTACNTNGNQIHSVQKTPKHSIEKLQGKYPVPSEKGNACFNKMQNHNIQHPQNDSRIINKKVQGDTSIPYETTPIRVQKKYSLQSSQKQLFISESENCFSRSVPIKPASHLNQRTVNFKNNSRKSNFKEQNIQHGNISCPKSSSRNGSLDKTKWKTFVPSNLHHNMQFRHSIEEPPDHKATTQPIQTCISACSEYLSTENQKQHNNCQPNAKYKNSVEAHHSGYLDQKHVNEYPHSEETDSQLQKVQDTCNSDTESKDNGFESTDSGIFTISREFDQNLLNQINSTEDLYIDDEFCLEMELDSHMQLLCLFDSHSEYNEHFINSIQGDSAENENICS